MYLKYGFVDRPFDPWSRRRPGVPRRLPRVGYHPTYRGDNEVYLCRNLRITAIRPWPGPSFLQPRKPNRQTKRPQLRPGPQLRDRKWGSWLRTRRFSEPTFRPSGATNHWKNTVFRDFPTFSRICIFFLLTLSLLIFSLPIFLFSLPLPCSAFHLSILSEVWLLNFLRLYIYNT